MTLLGSVFGSKYPLSLLFEPAINLTDPNRDISGLNVSLWMYPSFPVAILSLAISIFSRTKLKGWIICIIIFCTIVGITTGIAIAISHTYGHGIEVPATVLILFMGIPWWALALHLIVLTIIFATFAKIAGQVVGTVTPGAYFPFCALRGWGFARPNLALGILSTALALYGCKLKPRAEITTVDVELTENKDGYQ
ncbi:hypothetical protein CPB84DRAFT_1848892 [Gymnopilus junonius]|uniref:Uncharacterized protein n=1 Tax=Gymnopilus junonius TaxID=109634 RepID=A0A9P5NJ90_GYMJU|nr:hypothetical protein CPB84DRAFT_1848892 [Gymnopilus junonius]